MANHVNSGSAHAHAERLTQTSLRDWPLPMPGVDGDKEQRGRVLIVGGSAEIAGSVLLAAESALRSGAGKVTIATGRSIALAVAVAIPEARVIALPETDGGALAADGAELISDVAQRADAMLIGPGMQDQTHAVDLTCSLLQRLETATVVLDALAMSAVCDARMHNHGHDLLLTPHAGEMAGLCGLMREQVAAEPLAVASEYSRQWRATVAIKGATTCITTRSGRMLIHEGGNPGLAVSGSGDCLAGIVVALAARGASLEQACAWGVVLHAQAGQRLCERYGPLGFLARELSAQVPALLQAMA